MKRRFLYLVMFSLPTLMAALAAAFVVAGVAAGGMWLFVWGDDPWPPIAETILVGLFGVTAICVWIALLAAAFFSGKSQERQVALNSQHAMAAGVIILLLAGAMALHQYGIGNIGPKSDSVVCSQFCAARGFAGSSMPPRDAGTPACTCLDAAGREAVTVPLKEARSLKR